MGSILPILALGIMSVGPVMVGGVSWIFDDDVSAVQAKILFVLIAAVLAIAMFILDSFRYTEKMSACRMSKRRADHLCAGFYQEFQAIDRDEPVAVDKIKLMQQLLAECYDDLDESIFNPELSKRYWQETKQAIRHLEQPNSAASAA